MPILNEFRQWLRQCQVQTPPRSLLGKAVNYALNHWNALMVYTRDGRIRIDNNLVENIIRPFVLGRKNWLFAGSPAGAQASAFFYTLIENAKANGLEPRAYLCFLFDSFPRAATQQERRALLPQRLTPKDLEAHQVQPGGP